MKLEITRKSVPGIIIWTLYAALLYMHITLTFGSYAEMEPKAGNIFAALTGLVIAGGVALFIWRRRSGEKA